MDINSIMFKYIVLEVDKSTLRHIMVSQDFKTFLMQWLPLPKIDMFSIQYLIKVHCVSSLKFTVYLVIFFADSPRYVPATALSWTTSLWHNSIANKIVIIIAT